uniref:Ig-like domain-containing protein n=1 Tax=Canis lupus familiaris TaxID=9615 RepID=A0A8C0TVR2_CANLF
MKTSWNTLRQPKSLWSPPLVRIPTMAWTVFLLVLLTYGSGADSQIVVTQETSLSVSAGGTLTLTCGLSSGSVTTSNYPSWYQQTPGQAPSTVIYNTNSRPSGVPDRFSGSVSGNKAVLIITGTQPEDEADDYSVAEHVSGSSFTYPQHLR